MSPLNGFIFISLFISFDLGVFFSITKYIKLEPGPLMVRKMDEKLHIGVILDGNRRYAKKRGLLSFEGHRYGAERVRELVNWCSELGVGELTLYTFSMDNFNRPQKEKDVLFKLFREYFKRFAEDKRAKKVKINFIGRLDLFPRDMQDIMNDLMEKTAENTELIVNFAMGYGGRAEIVDACKRIAEMVEAGKISPESIDEEMISQNLYLLHEPDLIIRPGGEKRVSNFLLWQGYYSEWYFSDKLWPEITKEDFEDAIKDYNSRERRYGK